MPQVGGVRIRAKFKGKASWLIGFGRGAANPSGSAMETLFSRPTAGKLGDFTKTKSMTKTETIWESLVIPTA